MRCIFGYRKIIAQFLNSGQILFKPYKFYITVLTFRDLNHTYIMVNKPPPTIKVTNPPCGNLSRLANKKLISIERYTIRYKKIRNFGVLRETRKLANKREVANIQSVIASPYAASILDEVLK